MAGHSRQVNCPPRSPDGHGHHLATAKTSGGPAAGPNEEEPYTPRTPTTATSFSGVDGGDGNCFMAETTHATIGGFATSEKCQSVSGVEGGHDRESSGQAGRRLGRGGGVGQGEGGIRTVQGSGVKKTAARCGLAIEHGEQAGLVSKPPRTVLPAI